MSAKRKMAHLTEETLVEYRAAFDALDYNNSGKISTPEVAPLMRRLGLMPSNLEVDELVAEVDKDKNAALEGITFEQFCIIAAQKYNEIYTENDINEAFRTFDLESNGFIPASELRRALCGMGEKLNDDEMDALLETAQQDADGNVHYESFVRNMYDV
ncbi:Calmodulin [Paragonimus heterotremus]|uniref:Calmodulin n=1 Tax=Paragonimus heterotremus TaxID=100268 RepID=A0A8J4WEV6_9TREM|nr:Calmodulin [Paragonimus heterotremus]